MRERDINITPVGGIRPPLYLQQENLLGISGQLQRDRRPRAKRELLKDLEVVRLSDDIVQDYCDLNAWRIQEGMTPLLDVMVVKPPAQVKPIPPKVVLRTMHQNYERIENLGLHNVSSEWEVGRANLLAAITFQEEETRVMGGGKPLPASKFFPKVVGKELGYTDRDELLELREDLFRLFKSEISYFDESWLSSTRTAFHVFQQYTKIDSQEKIERIFNSYYQPFKSDLANFIGIDLTDLDVNLKWTESPEFFMMLEQVTPNENILEANWHRKHRKHWTRGRIDYYTKHEPTHFVLPHSIKLAIERGEIDKIAGFFPMPSPSSFQMEGLAQTVTDYIHPPVTTFGQIAAKVYRLEKRALNNAMYDMEIDGIPPQSAILSLRSFMPTQTTAEIEQKVEAMRKKPFDRAFLGSIYGESDGFMMSIKKATTPSQQQEIFRSLSAKPMTPQQMEVTVREKLKVA
ncbi:hypothetical protein HY382_01285 [Candidatus Curtissbacteria bacterium]|nr:hypothetical protein [Candidatus Curtissbacteria bacterium]